MVKTGVPQGPILNQYLFMYFQMALSFLFPNVNFVTMLMTTLCIRSRKSKTGKIPENGSHDPTYLV